MEPTIDSQGNKRYYDENGKFHSDDGPAIIYPDGTQEWWQNGRFIRITKIHIESQIEINFLQEGF